VITSEGTVAAEAAAWVPPTWEEVVREHGNRVYRLAYRLTGNAHDAEDLTQDVFVRVFRSLADFTPGTFEGWLHRITTNLFLDRMRRQQKIRFDALPDDTERLAGREPSPEAVYAEARLDADIESALAALPPDFRAAVVLCDIEQLSYEEIAQTLGVKLGTVRSRISRGRAMLRQALADRAPRPEGSALADGGALTDGGDRVVLADGSVVADGGARTGADARPADLAAAVPAGRPAAVDGARRGLPADPALIDPALIDPAPTDPAPTDPAFIDPAFIDPVPVDAVSVDPVAVDPASAESGQGASPSRWPRGRRRPAGEAPARAVVSEEVGAGQDRR
jgi:RNA polymerase sigma-70 factor (ECF subfamily)